MKLSRRMEAVAAMVTAGNILADVGTDHGHVPIALVERGRIPRAIAMDLREGPLAHAKENIAIHGLEDRISTRLSDGVEALAPGEAETIVIAGMGGELVVHILSAGEMTCRRAKELILQPQSELSKVRLFLVDHGYRITDENMVFEDGKYYPMMRVVPDAETHGPGDFGSGRNTKLWNMQLEYGPCLLKKHSAVLLEYLKKEHGQLENIRASLMHQPRTEHILARLSEVMQKIDLNETAQTDYAQN